MSVKFQVIRNHVSQNIGSVVIHVTGDNYIFNVSEGFQRHMKPHWVKLNSSNRFFMTRMSTDHITGLFGLMLTLNVNQGSQSNKIYGPQGIVPVFKEGLYLYWTNMLYYSVYEFGSKRILKGLANDKCINEFGGLNKETDEEYWQFIQQKEQQSIDLINDASRNIVDQNGQSVYKDNKCTVIPIIVEFKNKEVISYVMKVDKRMGKIQMDKVNQLKIPKQMLGKLQKDKQIVLDGEVIRIEQVVDKGEDEQLVIIVDCPDLGILEQLKQQIDQQINEQYELQSMVHLNDRSILGSDQYQQFMKCYKCEHMIVCWEARQDILYKAHYFQKELAKYFPQCFMQQQNGKYYCLYDEMVVDESIDFQKVCKFYERIVYPKKEVNYVIINKEETENQIVETPFFQEQYQKYKMLKANESNKNYEISFLGTGSQIPSSFRNVSSIFIKLEAMNVLLDCGEGSFNQFYDLYSDHADFIEMLRKIRVIYITHIHGDHMFGIPYFVKRRKQLLEKNGGYNQQQDGIFLVYSFNNHPWYWFYQKHIEQMDVKVVFSQNIDLANKQNNICDADIELDYQEIKNQNCFVKDHIKIVDLYGYHGIQNVLDEQQDLFIKNLQEFRELLIQKQIKKWKTVEVDHCPQSYAVCIETGQLKVAYSGDTRICEALQKAVQGYDYLIHECTFEDKYKSMAHMKQHSTASQAIKTGLKAGVQTTVLTHFSQRYSKSFKYQTDPKRHEKYWNYYQNNTIVAYDFMSINEQNREFCKAIKHSLEEIVDDK